MSNKSKKKENKKGYFSIQVLIAEMGENKWKLLSPEKQEEKIKEKKEQLNKEAPVLRKEIKDKNKQYRGKINR